MNFKEVSLLCLMGSYPILIYSVNVTIWQPFDLNETVPHQLHGGQELLGTSLMIDRSGYTCQSVREGAVALELVLKRKKV